MNVLENITAEKILNEEIPISELLDNSFYYPASGLDGGIVKYYGKEIQSFIYCDYAIGEEDLVSHLNDFLGYQVLAHRSVGPDELVPNGWKMQLPPGFSMQAYYKYRKAFVEPYAHWAVYERKGGFSDSHGPKRFSLIFIGGEGVATYQALYWSNRKTAKALAIIQPGTGFGLNWTDFRDKNGALAWVVLNNPYGKPEIIFYGGVGDGYTDFSWEGYALKGAIKPYYDVSPFGKVTIWTRE